MRRVLRRCLATAVLVAGAGAGFAGGDAAGQAKSPTKSAKGAEASREVTPQRRQQLQAEQRQLQRRLGELKQRLAAAEASHSEVADALSESEQAISTVNRRMRELAEARRQVERQISSLQDRGRATGARQTEQEAQLSRLLRAELGLSRQVAWQRWLAGDPPGSLGREQRYTDLAAQARARSIGDLRERREQLQQLEAESVAKQTELAAIAQEEKQARVQLLRQQDARKQTLARLSRQISGQRRTIVSLERDDQRLATLVEQLARLLAEQARRAEESRKAAAAAARRGAARGSEEAEPAAGAKTAALRGKLHLPVQGEIAARFGAVRRTEAGVNAPTWKGVFIRAPQGTDVRAVAAGRVVFADWLRGFGNLLIVDHGDGLLSVYGNNESLLRSVGEKIDADEVIAVVGNTGGNTESGLYFELRLEGRPIDPLKWAQAR